jgi:hypothetical protein
VVAMKKLRINPNRPRDLHDETTWLERDQAAIHHLDFEDSPAPASEPIAAAPLPPDRSVEATPAASQPPVTQASPPKQAPPRKPKPAPVIKPDHRTGAAAPDAPPDHGVPLLLATFLATLPQPEAAWSCAERVDWLRAAEGIFHLVYKTEGRIRIEPEA